MTVTQPKVTLRYLAKEYAAGRLDYQAYRLRRAQLLHELADYTPPPPAPQRELPSEPAVVAKAADVQRKTLGRLLIGLIGALALVVVAGTLLFLYGTGREPMPEPALSSNEATPAPVLKIAANEPSPPPAEAETKPAEEDPIKAFMVGNDWSPERRARLVIQWDLLSPEAKTRYRSTSRFLAFRSDLRALIEEERGLAGGEASASVDSLLAFAARLGLDFTPIEREPLPLSTRPPEADAVIETPKPAEPVPTPPENVAPPKEQEPPPAIPKQIEKPLPAPEQKAEPDVSSKPAVQTTKPAAPPPPPPVQKESLETITADPVSEEEPPEPTPTGAKVESCHPALATRKIFRCQDRLKNGGKGPRLQLLPGGRFEMGRNDIPNESPRHPVTLRYPFAIGTYEVSQQEYALYCEASGRAFPLQPWKDEDLPVVNVNRDDAKGYAEWLSMQSGHPYRLPTEAEWEYAARAGTTGAYPLPAADLGTYAHYSSRAQEEAPLPRKPQRTNPNSFGLFHMAGNVREWVLDSWSNGYANAPSDGNPQMDKQEPMGIVRGGSYADDRQALGSSARQPLPFNERDRYTGFRLVRDVFPKPYHEDLTRWGGWWASYQGDNQLTLQLAAADDQNQLLRLLESNPHLGLKLFASTRSTPGYLLLLGVFSSEAEATAAYRRLPTKLKHKLKNHTVKTFGELR